MAAEAATVPARDRIVAIRRAATYGRLRLASRRERETFRERVVEPAEQKLARLVLRVNPRTTVESVTAKLLAAGLARKISATQFLAAKGGFAIVGFLLGALYGRNWAGGAGSLLAGALIALLTFKLPDFVLSRRARGRQEAVCIELPDALDLLAVSVEAGLSFDGAIAKLKEHMDGPLSEEFGLVLNQMRIGETRQDALRQMAERVPAPELS